MGQRITKLTPFGGFCAETSGAITLFVASHFGIPVSTTHTITGAISGVGAAQRLSARSEEHTSELQSPCNLVCRLLLEKKNIHSNICENHRHERRQHHAGPLDFIPELAKHSLDPLLAARSDMQHTITGHCVSRVYAGSC